MPVYYFCCKITKKKKHPKENWKNNVKYSGEVPPSSEYRNSDNKALGSNELKKKVEEKLKKEVNGHIDSMVNDLKRI